jgi:SAM-dependent methyltransferase
MEDATLNEEKLNEFMGKVICDMGAAISGALIVVGDRLGLFKALAENGAMDAAGLATATGTHSRYVQEWLSHMASSGYVNYDAAAEKFSMTPEQAAAFAVESSPALVTGGFYAIASIYNDESKLADAFKSGDGIAWGDHHSCLFCGTAKFFKPGYEANLVQSWLPALDGVKDQLESGIEVADVGCGYGLSTMIMAEAYPKSNFVGFDIHDKSIAEATRLAAEKGIKNIRFEVSTAKDFAGTNYGLVAFFDCLHDMGDPRGAAAHVKQSLAEGGTWMIVEPFANDKLEDNINPVGRVYYGFSTAICTPASLSQEVGEALGAQAGEARLREVVESGGFTHFRRAFETPLNLVLEAK